MQVTRRASRPRVARQGWMLWRKPTTPAFRASLGDVPTRVVVLARNSNVFLQNDLDALAAAFDEVVVIGYMCTGPRLRLAPNVRVLGMHEKLPPMSRWAQLRTALSPRFAMPALSVIWGELRDGRLPRHAASVWVTLMAGARMARLPGLREAIGDRTRRVTVYSHWGTGLCEALPWLPRPNAGMVMRLHRVDLDETPPAYLPMRSWLYRRCDALVFVSSEGLDHVSARHPRLDVSAKSAVLPVGVRDRGTSPSPVGTGAYTIVTCSYIVPVKRLTLLAEAFAGWSLPREVRWVHFGDGPLRHELERAAAALSRVKLELKGHVDNEQVIDFYRSQAVDLFVSVSEAEGAPVSISEALSFGIPVAATAVGASPQIIGRAQGTGVLIPPNPTPAEVLQGVEEALLTPREQFDPRRAWSAWCDAGLISRFIAVEIVRALNEGQPPRLITVPHEDLRRAMEG